MNSLTTGTPIPDGTFTRLLHEYTEAPSVRGGGEEKAPLILESRGKGTVEEEHLGSGHPVGEGLAREK